jgi:hypothetical protein
MLDSIQLLLGRRFPTRSSQSTSQPITPSVSALTKKTTFQYLQSPASMLERRVVQHAGISHPDARLQLLRRSRGLILAARALCSFGSPPPQREGLISNISIPSSDSGRHVGRPPRGTFPVLTPLPAPSATGCVAGRMEAGKQLCLFLSTTASRCRGRAAQAPVHLLWRAGGPACSLVLWRLRG